MVRCDNLSCDDSLIPISNIFSKLRQALFIATLHACSGTSMWESKDHLLGLKMMSNTGVPLL